MIDLHTHILPGIDDGAPDVDTALAMLRRQGEQGVTGVALTPHFYRDEGSPSRFLARRRDRWQRLREGMEAFGGPLPQTVLGAEVCWTPGISQWDELEQLCLGNSSYLLLELPDTPWRSSMLDEIYDLMGTRGVTPVLAHLDRYFATQRPEHLGELLSMGVPIQISAAPLLGLLSRGRVARKIRGNPRCLLISDCHDLTHRPPNLGTGVAAAKKCLPQEQVAGMLDNSAAIFARAVGEGGNHAPQ